MHCLFDSQNITIVIIIQYIKYYIVQNYRVIIGYLG